MIVCAVGSTLVDHHQLYDDLMIYVVLILQAFRNKLEFFAAAKSSSSFPPPDLPEIAFAGRLISS